ncbi:MAG: hypothetical protein RDU76_11610 [Candidatus Edwardsbacteria bacterium]|nr:hypothetical protein [Candidatus Edwardsbacteria bacterium]
MAWNDISSSLCDIGKGLTTTLMNYIRGNLDYLKANTGTGNIHNLLTNPSFENYDPDTFAPDNWDITLATGSSAAVVPNNSAISGLAWLQVVPPSSGDTTVKSSFMEINYKKLLRWKLFLRKYTAADDIQVKVYFYKGDQTDGTVTPDVNGSSYPQPGELPENAHATAGAGYAIWDFGTVIPHAGPGIDAHTAIQGIIQPPSDARWAKIEIIIGATTGYVYLDALEVYQPDFDDRDYISASANLKISLDTEKSSVSTDYVKAKEFRVYQHGIYTVKFDLKRGAAPYIVYGRIYKNGIAYGTEQSDNTGSYVVKTADLEFGQGDTIELWIKASNASSGAYVQNFQLFFDEAKVYGYGKDIL